MTLKEIRELLASGKPVQFKGLENWHDVSENEAIEFSCSAKQYRLKPEPKLRPWRPEEVPCGAITRAIGAKSYPMIIVAVCAEGVELGGDDGVYLFSQLATHREHSTDGGKTWLPCGVEVTE